MSEVISSSGVLYHMTPASIKSYKYSVAEQDPETDPAFLQCRRRPMFDREFDCTRKHRLFQVYCPRIKCETSQRHASPHMKIIVIYNNFHVRLLPSIA